MLIIHEGGSSFQPTHTRVQSKSTRAVLCEPFSLHLIPLFCRLQAKSVLHYFLSATLLLFILLKGKVKAKEENVYSLMFVYVRLWNPFTLHPSVLPVHSFLCFRFLPRQIPFWGGREEEIHEWRHSTAMSLGDFTSQSFHPGLLHLEGCNKLICCFIRRCISSGNWKRLEADKLSPLCTHNKLLKHGFEFSLEF